MRFPTRLMTAILVLAMVSASVSDIWAKDKFSFDGQIRLRDEFDLKATDTLRHSKTFHDLRTRVGLKFEPTRRTMVYIQLQDSRRLGDPSSGDLVATDNVDLHQAYFEVKDAVFEDFWIKAGRFELNYGNQRIFGSVGWHNVGRSWEGGLFSFRGRQFRFDFFTLRRMEMNDEDYNRDFDIFGLYGSFPRINLDLFGFYELNADTNNYVQERLKRFNLGGFYSGTSEDFDFVVQAALQSGEQPRDTIPDKVIQDISAFMFAGEIGYNFAGRKKGRIALGLDYTSGDDGKDSTTYEAYTSAYYTAHKFQGYMDLFSSSPVHGLVDIMLRGKIEPARRWLAKADIHFFKAAEDYLSMSDGKTLTRDIGVEIDLTVANKSISGATVTGGLSLFSADEHYSPAGDDNKTGVWAYLMTEVNF